MILVVLIGVASIFAGLCPGVVLQWQKAWLETGAQFSQVPPDAQHQQCPQYRQHPHYQQHRPGIAGHITATCEAIHRILRQHLPKILGSHSCPMPEMSLPIDDPGDSELSSSVSPSMHRNLQIGQRREAGSIYANRDMLFVSPPDDVSACFCTFRAYETLLSHSNISNTMMSHVLCLTAAPINLLLKIP